MGQRHFGRLAKREGRRWKHQQRRSPASLRLACDPRRLQAADSPCTAPTSRKWARKFGSSIDRSAWNGSSTAGITP